MIRPFSHLKESLEKLTDFPAKVSIESNPLNILQTMLDAAIEKLEHPFLIFASREISGSNLLDLLFSNHPEDINCAIEAIEKSQHFIPEEFKDTVASVYNLSGHTFGIQASTKTGADADELWKQAFGRYAAAKRIKPDKYETLMNWGNGLTEQAKTKSDLEANELFVQAFKKYAHAIQIAPNQHRIFYNWGIALANQAKTKTNDEAEALWKQASEKFTQAIEINPNFHEAFANWGVAIDALARTKAGIEAEALWKQAIEKYARTIEIKPDAHETLYNWGDSLLVQAKTKTGSERQYLLNQAREILMQHHLLQPNNTYNLACLEALSGNESECQKWLENCLTFKTLPDCQHLSTDTDLDSVRKTAWFQDFMLRAGCSE